MNAEFADMKPLDVDAATWVAKGKAEWVTNKTVNIYRHLRVAASTGLWGQTVKLTAWEVIEISRHWFLWNAVVKSFGVAQ